MKRMTAAVLFSILTLGAWANGSQEEASKPIVAVWLPNNSGEDWKAARTEFDKLITKATGRPVTDRLTTDYVIAIEAMATGNAAVAYLGPLGFIQAQQKNPAVQPLVVQSGDSGGLDDAGYWSRIVVKTENAAQYAKGSGFTLDAVKGKSFSFVSSSSTSGFAVPATLIRGQFAKQEGFGDKKVEDLFLQGGNGMFFSNVVFGQSHQGSLLNVLTGKADVGAVDDIDVDSYVDLVSGTASTAGAVYQVKQGAVAPFDTVPAGTKFTVLAAVKVQNAPIAVNINMFTKDQLQTLQALFTSDEVTKNPVIFVPKDSKAPGLNKQNGKNRYLVAPNSWWDPIRVLASN